jgi:FkbM family methyltransferase
MDKNTITFTDDYGTFTLLGGEQFILDEFFKGKHWEQDELNYIIPIIPKNKNIVEIGAHVGTHTIPYAKTTSEFVYAFEPQIEIFKLLCHNVNQNNISNIILYNTAVCHYDGNICMLDRFADGDTQNKPIDYGGIGNFGGITIGKGGENVACIKLDSLNLKNIGFMHIDAQGSEPLIFYGAQNLIKSNLPFIFFENNKGNYLEEIILNELPDAKKEMDFDVIKFCTEIGYSSKIDTTNVLLIPGQI